MSTLWRADRVVTPDGEMGDAVVAVDGVVQLVARCSDLDPADHDVVDLRGCVITPSFVDAHVHTTATGLALDGLMLHDATSLGDALDRLAAHARGRPGELLRGTGWDESTWPERRPPTAAELDRATDGAAVYLARVDVHSAVASTALLERCDLTGLAGAHVDGRVTLDAHHAVRHVANHDLSAEERERAQRRALAECAHLGVGEAHEMSGPEIAGVADLEALLALVRTEPGVRLIGYWGALGDVDTPRRLGLVGAGGDLFCDGSLGSHTAALTEPYADDPTSGALRFDIEELVDHIRRCVDAGLQSGFHVIGDAAIDQVVTAYDVVAQTVGVDRVRAGRHRLEHAEMCSAAAVAQMARLGITASVQPAFDATWGGPDAMYAARLGADRAAGLNPYAQMHQAGVAIALGSDSPVTAIDPWGALRAAAAHRTPSSSLTSSEAFAAMTVGGVRAGGASGGALRPGQRADFAAWSADSCDPLLWSALAGAAPSLPEGDPTCTRLVVDGREVLA